MNDRDTDADWRALAVTDPYWAVSAADQFRTANITDDDRQNFLATGEAFIGWVFDTVRRHLNPDFAPADCLDFGCGVGRLLVPLAGRCPEVVGVDVAEGMLAEARRNVNGAGAANVRLVRGDDTLSQVTGPFDLITSYIVFQHVPPPRGQQLFARLVGLLRAGGVGVLHVTYSTTHHGDQHPFAAWPAGGRFDPPAAPGVRNALVILAGAVRVWLGKRFAPRSAPAPGGPRVMMYPYTLNSLVHALQAAGVRQLFAELSDHGGHYGMVLFFRKSPGEGYRA